MIRSLIRFSAHNRFIVLLATAVIVVVVPIMLMQNAQNAVVNK